MPPSPPPRQDALGQLFHPDNADGYRSGIRRTLDHLLARFSRVTGPATGRSPRDAAAAVAEVDLDRPLGDTDAVLAELDRLYLDDCVWFHEPTYAAHLNCPVLVPALLAELVGSAVNSSVDTFDQSVGATFIERHLVDWTAGRIGYGDGADGIFTTGGTQSNLQALHLARDRARELARARGRSDALADLRVLASADAHFSVQKAARLLGLPDDAVVPVAVDGRRRLDPAALERALASVVAQGLLPMAVVATAGTTDFGAIDPLPAVADLAHRYGTWLHVDAAYGGGLLCSRRRRHLLTGIERADSVTVDYHKTWFLPVAASALVVRDAGTLRHVTWHADYLNPKDAAHPNQVDKSLQTTRRFDALKLWVVLRSMGADQVGELFDAVIDLTDAVHDAVVRMPGFEVATPPHLSTLVFRYRPGGEHGNLDEAATAALNAAIRRTLYERGTAMVAATKVDGRAWLKLTLLNPRATLDDLLGVLAEVSAVGDELLQNPSAEAIPVEVVTR